QPGHLLAEGADGVVQLAPGALVGRRDVAGVAFDLLARLVRRGCAGRRTRLVHLSLFLFCHFITSSVLVRSLRSVLFVRCTHCCTLTVARSLRSLLLLVRHPYQSARRARAKGRRPYKRARSARTKAKRATRRAAPVHYLRIKAPMKTPRAKPARTARVSFSTIQSRTVC